MTSRLILKVLLPLSVIAPRTSHTMASKMKYVHYENGGAENMSIRETSLPDLRDGEVLVKVYATAINRADTLQRRGLYPPPTGESAILGLEVAGTIETLGSGCSGNWSQGARVMALLAGGGYAEYVAVPEDLLMPVPENLSFTKAAAIPEVWLTAYQLLHFAGELQKGDTVLIHAGGSGVGTAAVQLCVLAGCQPIITAGSAEKIDKALELGAIAGFNYKEVDFSEKVLGLTKGRGVDLILDCIGQSYYEKNMKSISVEGRWVLYGLLGGGSVNGDFFSQLLRKRVRLTATTLRARNLIYKKTLTDAFLQAALPLFSSETGQKLVPIIDTVIPFHRVVEAHQLMESNANTGKIVLQVRTDTGKVMHDEL